MDSTVRKTKIENYEANGVLNEYGTLNVPSEDVF